MNNPNPSRYDCPFCHNHFDGKVKVINRKKKCYKDIAENQKILKQFMGELGITENELPKCQYCHQQFTQNSSRYRHETNCQFAPKNLPATPQNPPITINSSMYNFASTLAINGDLWEYLTQRHGIYRFAVFADTLLGGLDAQVLFFREVFRLDSLDPTFRCDATIIMTQTPRNLRQLMAVTLNPDDPSQSYMATIDISQLKYYLFRMLIQAYVHYQQELDTIPILRSKLSSVRDISAYWDRPIPIDTLLLQLLNIIPVHQIPSTNHISNNLD